MTANIFKDYRHILNKVRNKSKNISYEEYIQAFNELYNLNKMELFDEIFHSFESNSMHNRNSFDSTLDILSKGLELSNRVPNKYPKRHIKYLTLIGILCRFNNYHKDAINFQILGLLQTEEYTKHIFYSNIAESLSHKNEFNLSLICYKRALSSLENFKDENIENYAFWKNHLLLHLSFCYIELNLIRESEKVLDQIEEIDQLNAYHANLYLLNDFLVKYYYEINEPIYRGSYQIVKENLQKNKAYNQLIKLNDFYLEKFQQGDQSFKIQLLEESHEWACLLNDELLQRKILIRLVDIYATIDEQKELVYLRKMHQLEKKIGEINHAKLTSIFLNQYITFFRELKSINDTIVKQKNELQEITYILSHDLKTPIRNINSFINLIEKESKDKESIKAYIDFIQESVKNMYHLADDLHDLNIFERNDEQQMNVNLNTLVKTVVNETGIKEIFGAEVISQDLPRYYCKLSDMALLFEHLIENGVKYNKSDKPTVHITCAKEGQYLVLKFKDNGIGIPEKYHDSIFSFFKRLHTNDVYEGTGFGLGIVKRIISKYNGSISVESSMYDGSCFTVALPL